MLVVIDGKIRASDANLDNISPSNVAGVKVLKGKNAESFGTNGNSGVLVINTRFGSSESGAAQNEAYQAKNNTTTSSKRIDDAHYRSSSIAGPGHADQVVHADVFEHATSLVTALNGILHGVDFVNGQAFLRGGSTVSLGATANTPMYIILDGVAMGNSSIDNISPHSIETVEVLKGPNAAIYGSEGTPGVLVITSRNQAEAVATTSSSIGSLQFKVHGFYKAREFYSPKYNVTTQSNTTPDLRSTLYWTPNLATDQNGNGSFEFYNSDGHGSFRVIVEGMDAKGNIGWQVYRYKVE